MGGVLGFNDPCITWDTPPALYVAAPIFSFIIYLALRYAMTSYTTALLSNVGNGTRIVIRMISWSFAVSSLCMSLIFVVPPIKGDLFSFRFHLTAFGQYIIFRWLAVFS